MSSKRPTIVFGSPSDEARCLIEALDEGFNQRDSDRLLALTGALREEARDMTDIVLAVEAVRERIRIYRISCQLRGRQEAEAAAETSDDDVTTDPLRK